MSKLKKTIAETPDIGPLQRIFGKTIEVIELIAIIVVALVVALVIASALGVGG